MFHICFIYFHLAFKQQQLFNNDINDNATTQQQLDYAICMWYQTTLCWNKGCFTKSPIEF